MIIQLLEIVVKKTPPPFLYKKRKNNKLLKTRRKENQKKNHPLLEITNEDELLQCFINIVANVPKDNRITAPGVGEKLQDLIGDSWNKKFKKDYGSIKTYIESKKEYFTMDKNENVSLKPQPIEQKEEKSKGKNKSEKGEKAQKNKKDKAKPNKEKEKVSKKSKDSSPSPPQKKHKIKVQQQQNEVENEEESMGTCIKVTLIGLVIGVAGLTLLTVEGSSGLGSMFQQLLGKTFTK